MDTWTFRKENEVKLPYAPRIAEEVWTRQKATIVWLHDAKKPRDEILEILRDQYEFNPLLGQLNSQMSKLGLKVYRPRTTEDGVDNTTLPNFSTEKQPRSSSGEPIASPLTSGSNTGSVNASRVLESANNIESEFGPAQDYSLLRSETLLLTSSVRDAETQSLTHANYNSSSQFTIAQGLGTSDRQAFFSAAELGIEHSDTISGAGREVLEPADKNAKLEDVSERMEITETEAKPTTPPRSFFAKSHISSLRSDTSSVRDFKQLAHRLNFKYNASVSSRSQGSAISIDSRESWNFSKVTGMPKDSMASDGERERAASQKSCEWTSDQWLKVLTRKLEKKSKDLTEIPIEVSKPVRERTYSLPWASAMPAFWEKFRQLAMILEDHECAT